MSRRNTIPGLIPVGFQTITLSNSTAVGLNGTVRPCSAIRFTVETNDVRVRSDGTDPTLTTGLLFKVTTDTVHFWEGIPYGSSANVSFQRSTGTATVHLESYRRPGDIT